VLLFVFVFALRDDDSTEAPGDDLSRRLEKLRSVPYTAFTEETVDSGASGVRIYKPDKASPGYNLYCVLDSFRVNLIDMTGDIIHSWSYPQKGNVRLEHAVMMDNGDILIIEKYRNLLRLDWHSRPLWKSQMHIHHEVAPLSDGTFYVILREVRTHRGLRVRFPAIAHLSSTGEELERWSSYEHLDEIKRAFDQTSFLDTVLGNLLAVRDSADVYENLSEHPDIARLKRATRFYDYFHLNTITILPDTPLGRKDQRFRAGNLLICFRNVNQIAVLEKDTKQILWVWGEGILEWPHHPTMLDNDNILVFDNGIERNYSRVIELNPRTEELEWEYVASPPNSFYSYSKGSAQRLPNGNTLICEGDMGRAFEVTREGEIVWEWLNPNLMGGRRGQIYRMTRIDPGIVEPLLRP
jgi:hypothetical protein